MYVCIYMHAYACVMYGPDMAWLDIVEGRSGVFYPRIAAGSCLCGGFMNYEEEDYQGYVIVQDAELIVDCIWVNCGGIWLWVAFARGALMVTGFVLYLGGFDGTILASETVRHGLRGLLRYVMRRELVN